MGVSVSEGTITKWLKGQGERVQADEPLLEISTDKVDTEVPSPAGGVVAEILAQEGETVAVGTTIALISAGETSESAPAPAEPATTLPASEPAPAQPVTAPPEPATAPAAAEAAAASSAETVQAAGPSPPEAAETTDGNGRPESGAARFVSPVVARIAAEHGVDVGAVRGTGRGGRVTKKDILAHIEATGAAPTAPAPPAPPAPAPATPAEPPPAAEPPPPPAPPRPAPAPAAAAPGELLEPMSPMRKGIAEHMRRSLDTSAHVTTVFEVDMSNVVAIRERLKREYEERHGVKLTLLAFVARAAVDALGKWPWLNAEVRGDQIAVKGYVNLGIAVALDEGKGLIVPVIKNAEDRNLLGIARAIQDLAERARTKKLLPDDVQGGTFTITNPGGFGEIVGTPIISQPQVGILDTAAMVKRPVVVTDEHGNDVIAIRPMMNLCLAFDHRLVDGAYAGQFMRDLKAALETWDESSY
jgi:2-oxoglutarate dehydrogenase E2 component (dihydrolipoamide succinyltransferase)